MKPSLCLLLLATLVVAAAPAPTPRAQSGRADGGELAWAVHYDPKTLDPLKVDDQASELVRYLTGGVLVRLDRSTLSLKPELAENVVTSADGKLISIRLRPGLRFSDGSALTSIDVQKTLQRALAPATAAPVAEEFVMPAKVSIDAPDPLTVLLHLPVRVVSIQTVLDEIAIEPANRITESRITAGPFTVGEVHKGESLLLRRNPFYWKRDGRGNALPGLSRLRLDVVSNRESEEARFLRGQYGLMESVPPETFTALKRRLPGAAHDLGPSLNTEQMWFNQSQHSPLPAYEKRWFMSRAFRTAISESLHRADLARIAYDGHATPANGFISPANTTWYNHTLAPVHEDTRAALDLLASEGFGKRGDQLFDREGHPVVFSLLTNAGNRARERMAALIQQDLAAIGMRVNIVTLDYPALTERLMHTGDYEAALLGLGNVQPDPSSMMNIWLSNSPQHQWNPSQTVPATPWEAEVDAAFRSQAVTGDLGKRKAAIDRVQSIVAEEKPFIYLVYPNALCALSPKVQGATLSVLQPSVLSSVETMHFSGDRP